jgi:hypothetical protein
MPLQEIDMPKGQATGRRAGPAPDPSSARSEQRGINASASFTALPAEGHKGRPPSFERLLPKMTLGSAALTKSFRARELAIWRRVWKTPQAAAWAREPWRHSTVALYCRIEASVERDPKSNAALLARLKELRTEIGLSPDGLRLNGWKIKAEELQAKPPPDEVGQKRQQRRLRA